MKKRLTSHKVSEERKANYTIAADGESASNKSMLCYSMSKIEEKLGIDFGEKVQSNVRVRSWFREKKKELAKKYASSTCELEEATTLSMWLADQGMKEFLILASKVNFHAQPVIVRVVKKRRRRIRVQINDEGYSESEEFVEWNVSGQSGKCGVCGSGFHVSSYVVRAKTGCVFLCCYCAKEWAKQGKL